MTRILQIGLIGGVILATAAFGGTEQPYFFAVQIVLLALGGLLLVRGVSSAARGPVLPVKMPFLMIGMIPLQILPLPMVANSVPRQISIAPYETLLQLAVMATYLSAFYLAIETYRQPHGASRLVFALLGLGAVEACCGLFQYLTGYRQIFGYTKIVNLEMATGTYINCDHFAGLMEMTLPFALAGAFLQFQRIAGRERASFGQARALRTGDEFQKLFSWAFLAVLLLVALVFSMSRMGLVSAILSATLMMVLIAVPMRQKSSAFPLALAFLAPVLSIVIWIGPEPVIARFEKLVEHNASASDSRVAIWKDTLRLMKGHPWVGTGLGTFVTVYPSVQTAYPGRYVEHAHNDYLEYASELGIPATLLLFGAIFFVLGRSVKSFRSDENNFERAFALGCFGSITGILLHSLTDFNLHIPANALVFSVILGISYSNSMVRREKCRTASGVTLIS